MSFPGGQWRPVLWGTISPPLWFVEALEQPGVISLETLSCVMAKQYCGLKMPQLAILLGCVLKLGILRLALHEMWSTGRSSGHRRRAHEEDSRSQPPSFSSLS